MKSRYAARADENQPLIVDALRKAGCFVQPLHAVGQGVPDLLVGKGAVTYLIEVKDGAKPPSRRVLTPVQRAWHDAWRGRPVAIVETVEDALAVIGMGVQP